MDYININKRINFEKVLHYFKFESPTGLLHDYHQGYPEPDIYTQFQKKKRIIIMKMKMKHIKI